MGALFLNHIYMTKATTGSTGSATSAVQKSAKDYIKGSVRARKSDFGQFLALSLSLEDLSKHVNEKGFVNFTVFKRQFISEYGDTHYACVVPMKTENDEFLSAPDASDGGPGTW